MNDESNTFGYSDLKAHIMEPNGSYLSHKDIYSVYTPPSDGITSFMMMLSLLQYQAPAMNSTYSTAASQAGKAAFIESGAPVIQNKITSVSENAAKNAIHSMGITDGEVGVVLGSAKVVRDRKMDLTGPSIFSIKTNLTLNQDGASIGLKYDW